MDNSAVDQVYNSPVKLLRLAVIFSLAVWGAYNASTDLLCGFKGRRKE